MALPGATLIKLITGAKLIYDAHELESDKSGQTPSLSKATIIIERFCWSSIDHLISVSSSILNWYHSNLGSKPSSLVLNSPVIKESCSTSDRYFHDLYNISYDKLVFVYLGILGHGRAIEIILEAFCKEKIKSHVVFVGYGELESKIKEFSLQNVNIHLHKPVPHEEVVSLVKNADIGLCLIENVSLSDYYCLPNKLFEYTFAGTPVLASDFPEIRKFVEQYHLGSCCTLDPSSIFNSILDMENSKPERLTDDLAELSWQNQAKKLVTAYETLK
jgi:glycosyltransferase involved in cell wall biosynthesis